MRDAHPRRTHSTHPTRSPRPDPSRPDSPRPDSPRPDSPRGRLPRRHGAFGALTEFAGRPVVVGSGLAGLLTALELAPLRPVLVTAGDLGIDCASDWAQGGLAAAVGPDDDVGLHAADTLAAGAGLCDPAAVRAITAAGPQAVQRLLSLGARLDRNVDGTLSLGLEGAHSRHRIVHAAGDGSGHELTRVAVEAVLAEPAVTVLTHARVLRLRTGADRSRRGVHGVILATADGLREIVTPHVVLATGGAGSLFRFTTNPQGARGAGLALGLRAGAAVRDLEFVQFHPTALDVDLDPMPLVSEAVRGHGARLIDETGAFLVEDDLAARDVVSQAVWAALERGQRVFLDTPSSLGAAMAREFPTVTAAARDAGIDPTTQPLPIRPAAHYHMGGLLVDLRGRTTVPGLWAVGEVASTGLHGANRLASNSLLEAVVCSRWVGRDVAAYGDSSRPAAPWAEPGGVLDGVAAGGDATRDDLTDRTDGDHPRDGERLLAAARPDPRVRALLTETAGVLRDHRGLARALAELRDDPTETDMRLVGLVLVWSALHRAESRGGHTRTDHPGLGPARHTVTTLPAVLADLRDATDQHERSA